MATERRSDDQDPSLLDTVSRQLADLRRAWKIRTTDHSQDNVDMKKREEVASGERYRQEIEELQSFIDRQFALIAHYSASPVYTAVVVAIDTTRKVAEKPAPLVYAIYNGRCVVLEMPTDISVEVGSTVLVSNKTLQILEKASALLCGETAILQRVIDKNMSEISSSNGSRIVLNGLFAETLKPGDRVVLDSSGSIILGNLGKKKTEFQVSRATGIVWDNVGGLEKTKRQLKEAIEWPHQFPKLYKKLGKTPPKGILLYGPSGCGKTLVVKALVSALAEIHGLAQPGSAFLNIKSPELLSKYVGETEATIREIFRRANEHYQEYGYPAVVFFDECDALMYIRGTGQSSDIEKTIVPTFLTEMDGLEESHAIVILATNRPDTLDPAITREGRIDVKIKVDRPTKESADQIFKIHLKNIAAKGSTLDELVSYAVEELFSDQYAFLEVTKRSTKATVRFTLAHIVSGAMIEGIVMRATSIVLNRLIESGVKDDTVNDAGITKEDINEAIADKLEENRDLDHSEAKREFAQDFADDIENVKVLRQIPGK